MLVVFTALVGSLTVLPALLGEARRPHRARHPPGARRGAARCCGRSTARPRWLVWLRETPTLLQRLKGEPAGVAGLGVRDRAGRCATRRSPSASRTAVWSCSRCPRSGCTRSCSASPTCRRACSIVKTYDTIQAVVPGLARIPRTSSSRRDERDDTAVRRRRTREFKQARARDAARSTSRSASPSTRPRPSPGSTSRSPATATTPRRSARSKTLRDEVIPPVLATLPAGTEEAVTGDDRRHVRLQPDDEARARRSCSRSCSGSPSCSCC